ncbi:hypothetical protein Poli38472_009934 [Pythium oligandrum]|uniref:PX domain-containing protein n=1 Tax=Pythium oligandrum TaxID=41045 RepID=A0A8K1C8F4_PYTOL|nr:hypothetical protein Poli38472_009934 [Pythium oligandrum]|eukprot:TMW58375.1 hypothetical protein Poli38472_009934 [Pythium oligandrum]
MGCNQSTPVTNPAAHAPPTSVTAAAVPSAPASNASVPASVEPESEAASASSPAKNGKYLISGVSITEEGIVYYHIHPSSEPNAEGIKRRYNDFKALYAELNGTESLPPLPQANLRTYFRGRHNQQLMKERENQFADILNAIANDAALSTTPAFQKFVS